MEAKEREAVYYQTGSGEKPYRSWRGGLSDAKVKVAIDARITRMRAGNFGNSKSVGEGVSESRIDMGPGYRIYYGIDGDKIVLLCGGDKNSQDGDIMWAKTLWRDYKDRTRRERATQ
ncbi:MAG: type II toxin-antitoxin system RelE/ParE family toxin [Bryobacteraceae bacterium]